jgi:5-methylthioadenosine/S-adenosylhomocysteine deaminase
MKLLIRNATIIPMTAVPEIRGGNAPFFTGDIAVSGEHITAVGTVPPDFVPDRIIDASRTLALPGLVNAHTHLSMGLLRNYADDLDLHTWLHSKIWPAEAHLDKEDVYAGSQLGILELIRSGVTAFADMYFFQEASCRAVLEAGLRARIGATFFGDLIATEARLPIYADLHRSWNGAGGGRIFIDAAPHAVYTCTRETLEAALDFSLRYDTRIHVHLSETRKENEDSLQEHGCTPAGYLESLGLFTRPSYAAHCVHLTQEDAALLKTRGVRPVHCPSSNLKLGSGFAPFAQMLREGLRPALGTDGASSNNNLNMIEELHIASLIHKGTTGDPTAVSAYEALAAATVHGAEALGIADRCGTLEPGKAADIILINTDVPHMQPLHNPVSAAVYSAQASDVLTVICNGEILMENRELLTIDEQEVMRRAAVRAAGLIRKAESKERQL